MRHERFIPMEYVNQDLMDALNDWCIGLKVWIHPELFGDALPDLQRRYAKPEIEDIDKMMHHLMQALKKDAKPLIRY
jgi:hypothetical protein